MADGSVRVINFEVAEIPVGSHTLLEALASRSGTEIIASELGY